MKSTIHALVIAIDNYPIAHHKLNGCVNDAEAMIGYLEGNYPCEQLNIKRIFDDKATKKNIIEGFKHFKDAKKGDTCLLYYSGHGSQAAGPKEFRHLDPDGKLETVVCWDSRVEGGKDLMDKEMSYLIWEATNGKEVHFTAVFDCCHSGTNTRDVRVASRQIKTPHPVPAFLKDFHGHKKYTINEDGTAITPPAGVHTHLAAAEPQQTAKELKIGAQTRGAFTYNLIALLEHYNGKLTYAEIIAHLDARIGKLVSQQNPMLSATQSKDKSKYFLGQTPESQPTAYAVNFDKTKKQWFINAGQVHGFPVDKAKGIELIIVDGEKEIEVGVSSVEMLKSYLTGVDKLKKENSYQAFIKTIPVKPVLLAFVDGNDAAGQAAVKQGVKDRPSTYYKLTTKIAEADYWVRTIEDSLQLTMPGDDRPVFRRIPEYTEESAKLFLGDVEAVAKWHHVREINNPKTSLKTSDYEIELYEINEAGAWEDPNADDAPATLVQDWRSGHVFNYDYAADADEGEKWKQPALKVKIKNTSTRTLHFSAVNLTSNYGIDNKFMESEPLEPGKEAWLLDRLPEGETFKTIPVEVPDAFIAYGVNEATEYFKIFISTKRVDTNSFNQEGLELDMPVTKRAGRKSAKHPAQHDWTVEDIMFKTVRPCMETTVGSGETQSLGGKIEVEMPEGISCMAALNTKKEGARGLDDEVGIPEPAAGWEMADLSEGMSNKPPVNMLEFYQTEGGDKVNVDHPIKINLNQQLAEGEMVVPVAFDKESGLYYPIGIMGEDGRIEIEQLPEPTATNTRSLGGSIKIFFQKAVGKYIPFVYTHPQLAISTLEATSPDEEAAAGLKVKYELDTEKIKAAVADANTIAVYIHGIIGDTTEMPKTMQLVQNMEGVQMASKYDLVMTFDYENLKTEIQETGRDLKARLEAVGLAAGHGKTLHIIAHSMGGLVSRWFIEKEGGNEIVTHLFQLGTPNQGSPYGSLYEMATPLLASAVNGAAFVQPYVLPLRYVGKFLDTMFSTLKQMNADSDFMKELNDGSDPGIPYTIIAGNTQKIPPKMLDAQQSLLKKVMARFKSRGHYDALDLLLFKEANDIAVSVKSISTILGADEREHPPVVLECACDHISYFGDPSGLEAMGKVFLT